MEKVIYIITEVLKIILIILMSLIVIDVSWQVFTRFILKNPSSFTEELAGFLLIWIGLLGASYALYTRSHLGIDLLTAKTTGLKKRLIEIIIYCIILLFALFILIIGGMRLVNLTFTLNQISPAIGIPMGYVYLVLPLTGVLMLLYSLANILNAIKKKELETENPQISIVD